MWRSWWTRVRSSWLVQLVLARGALAVGALRRAVGVARDAVDGRAGDVRHDVARVARHVPVKRKAAAGLIRNEAVRVRRHVTRARAGRKLVDAARGDARRARLVSADSRRAVVVLCG